MKKKEKAIKVPDTVPPDARNAVQNDHQEMEELISNALIYLQALEHSAEGFAQCNEDGLIILWNRKLEEITGLPKEEMLGKPIWDVHYFLLKESQKTAAYYDQLKESLSQALKKGNVPGMGEVLEWEYTRPDGGKLYIESSVYSIKTTKGYSLVSVTRDITNRKLVEKALQESEKKYRSLYDNAPLSFQSLNNQGQFIDVNTAWLRTLGYQLDEVIGQSFSDLLHPDFVSGFERNFHIFKEQGYIKDVHLKIRHKEGHHLDVLFEGCIGSSDDDTIRTYCVFQDISERMLAEEAVQRSEQGLRSIFRSAPIGIGVLADRVFLEVNDYAIQLLGYSEDELIGRDARMIYPTTEEYDRVGEIIYKQIRETGSGTIRAKLQHKEGSEIDVVLSAAALDEKNLDKGITFTALDITETERARTELLAAAQLWKTTFNAVDDAICIMDQQMRIIQHNTAMELMFPEHKDNIFGGYCYEIIRGSSEPVDLCPIKLAETSLKRESIDLKRNDKHLEITVDPLLGENDGFTGAVYTIRDQTERMTAKETLDLRAHQLEMLLESNLNLNASLDPGDVFQAAAESANRLLNIDCTVIYLLKGDEIYLGYTMPPMEGRVPDEFKRASLADHPHIRETITDQQIVMIEDARKADLTEVERNMTEARKLRTIVFLPITISLNCLGTMIIGTTGEPRAFSEEDLNVARTLTAQIAASLQNAILHDQSIQNVRDLEEQIRETLRAEERARELARQLIHLQEGERKRISQEMHDETGQLLTAISLDLWNLTQSLDDHDSAMIQESLINIKTLVDELDEIVGEITLDLRPPMLDDLGLAPTLQWYIDRYMGRTEVEVNLDIEKDIMKLPSETATALYRITQESLTNVVKHADASRVEIDLSLKANAVVLSIRDDGKGFKFDTYDDLQSTSLGMGLMGIRDRVDLLGGVLLINSQPGSGTLINVEIPI